MEQPLFSVDGVGDWVVRPLSGYFRLQRQRAGVLTLLTLLHRIFVMIFFGEIQPVRDPKRNEVAFNQQSEREIPDTENLIGYKMGRRCQLLSRTALLGQVSQRMSAR
jgi:hypothetical protein